MPKISIGQHDPFVQNLRAALQLPARTVWFELRAGFDEVTTVTCKFHPDTPEALNLGPVLATYKLVEVVPGEPGQPVVTLPPAVPDEEDLDPVMSDVIREHVATPDPERGTMLEAIEQSRESVLRREQAHRESIARSNAAPGVSGANDGLPARPAHERPTVAEYERELKAQQRKEWAILIAVSGAVLVVVGTYVAGWWP